MQFTRLFTFSVLVSFGAALLTRVKVSEPDHIPSLLTYSQLGLFIQRNEGNSADLAGETIGFVDVRQH